MFKLMTHFPLVTFQQFLLHNYQLQFNAQLEFFFSSFALFSTAPGRRMKITIFKKKKERNEPKKLAMGNPIAQP